MIVRDVTQLWQSIVTVISFSKPFHYLAYILYTLTKARKNDCFDVATKEMFCKQNKIIKKLPPTKITALFDKNQQY